MEENDKRLFDSLKELENENWEEFQEKTRFEWRLSYAIWTSIVAAIGSIIAGKATSIVPKVHILIALAICILPFAIHGIYLHWIQTCLRKTRTYIYKARKEMWKLVGDNEYEPPGEKSGTDSVHFGFSWELLFS